MPEAQVLGKGGGGGGGGSGGGVGERRGKAYYSMDGSLSQSYWRHFLQTLWAKLSILILKTHLTTGVGERARDVAIERLGHSWVCDHTPSPIKIVTR